MTDKKFKEAVASQNLPAVRDMLRIRLLTDHDVTGGMFSECWAECENAGIVESLYQSHDGRALSEDVSESNFNTLIGQLATNFSRDRLQCALRVAKKMWADEQSASASVGQTTRPAQATNDEQGSEERIVGKERIINRRRIPSTGNETGNSTKNNADSNNKRGNSFREKSNEGGLGPAVAVIAVAVIVGIIVLKGTR